MCTFESSCSKQSSRSGRASRTQRAHGTRRPNLSWRSCRSIWSWRARLALASRLTRWTQKSSWTCVAWYSSMSSETRATLKSNLSNGSFWTSWPRHTSRALAALLSTLSNGTGRSSVAGVSSWTCSINTSIAYHASSHCLDMLAGQKEQEFLNSRCRLQSMTSYWLGDRKGIRLANCFTFQQLQKVSSQIFEANSSRFVIWLRRAYSQFYQFISDHFNRLKHCV